MNGGTSWSIWPIYVYGTDSYRLGDVMSSGTPNPTIPTGKWWSLPSSPPIFLILNRKSTKAGIRTKVVTVKWSQLGVCCVQGRTCELVTILVQQLHFCSSGAIHGLIINGVWDRCWRRCSNPRVTDEDGGGILSSGVVLEIIPWRDYLNRILVST